MRFAPLALAVLLAACSASPEASRRAPTLTPQASGADVLLISAYAVDAETVWAAGAAGTVVKTTDGGATWSAMTVPGADSLQFRDVHAWSAQEALVLSIGNGTDSRVYRTEDGGATWAQTFVNKVPDAFYDCLDFWPDGTGLLFSDSVEGEFHIQRTTDFGRFWTRVPPEALPAAQEGEGSFASSGTCVAASGENTALIATGNAATPRLLRTEDRGVSWTVTEVPLAAGEAAGGASVAFGPDSLVIVAGGNIGAPEARSAAVAMWSGSRWRAGGPLPYMGAAYGVAFVPESGVALAVGPGGVAMSSNAGAGWSLLSDETHWGLAAAPGRAWLVGPSGRITRVDL